MKSKRESPVAGANRNDFYSANNTTPASTNEMIAAFRAAMIENIGAAPDHVIADGKIHRFSGGYYAMWPGTPTHGFMGDTSGNEYKWWYRGRLTAQQRYDAHQRMKRAKTLSLYAGGDAHD